MIWFIIGAIILLVVVLGVTVDWAGPCKKCGSWKNWKDIQTVTDDHQPHLRFDTAYTKCTACGHKVWRETSSRRVNNSIHPACREPNMRK